MELKEIVNELKKEMRCNCDLDTWQPEADTGHFKGCFDSNCHLPSLDCNQANGNTDRAGW